MRCEKWSGYVSLEILFKASIFLIVIFVESERHQQHTNGWWRYIAHHWTKLLLFGKRQRERRTEETNLQDACLLCVQLITHILKMIKLEEKRRRRRSIKDIFSIFIYFLLIQWYFINDGFYNYSNKVEKWRGLVCSHLSNDRKKW